MLNVEMICKGPQYKYQRKNVLHLIWLVLIISFSLFWHEFGPFVRFSKCRSIVNEEKDLKEKRDIHVVRAMIDIITYTSIINQCVNNQVMHPKQTRTWFFLHSIYYMSLKVKKAVCSIVTCYMCFLFQTSHIQMMNMEKIIQGNKPRYWWMWK